MKNHIKFYRLAVMLFTAAYMIYFFVRAYFTQNYEFFYYAIVIGFLLFLLIRISRKLYINTVLIAGVSFVVLLNFLGGTVYVNGIRLYEVSFFGGLLKYDNVVHFIGAFILAFLMIDFLFELLRHKFPKDSVGQMLFYFLSFFAAFGVVATIEVVEFIAVGLFGVEQQVGDYYNNAIDLAYNFWGVFLAVLIFLFFHMRKEKYKLIGDGEK